MGNNGENWGTNNNTLYICYRSQWRMWFLSQFMGLINLNETGCSVDKLCNLSYAVIAVYDMFFVVRLCAISRESGVVPSFSLLDTASVS